MSIVCTVPAPNCLFQARRASFKKYISPLKTLTRTVSAVLRAVEPVHGTESTRKHLSNLDKLLPKKLPQIDPAVLRPIINNGSLENKGTPGIWETLNFERIWPEMKTAEEMSPRNLNRLQRLLSMSPKYSPRNNLGSRWREYHGCNDWDGLLDPLDENLRREVVRYGEFIQAAYHCFHSDPATSPDEAQYIRHVALPDRSYKVTKSLYATSSIGLPKWVDDVAPDLEWMTQRTSWMGYVAVCDDPREIARMGRRDIVITLRGTATCLEWAENLRDLLVQLSGQNDPENPKVQCGFQSLFRTPGALAPCLAESVVEEIRRLMDLYKGENLSITVTGHSLGAALALLVADELSSSTPGVPPIAVFTFGGPRVGNRGFANRINSKNVKVLRIVNSQDLITRVPGMFVSEGLDQTLRNSSVVSVLDVLDNNMPWAYSHVGRELRVDTKMSPFLKPDADMACCHDLEAYLHLVDGFISSKCAFRANAKRSLVKLLHEQTPNVKKLYTSKAKALSLNIDHSRERLSMTGCLPSPSS